MDLIVWRHAEAEPGEPDASRRLTSKGVKHAERMAAWLEGHLPDTARILVSPTDRAQQTARALGRRYRTVAELAPGASAAALLAAADWPTSRAAVVVIGHQPTLGAAASLLLCGEESFWPIRKASLWWLSNRGRDAAGVVLRGVLGPDLLCRLPHLGPLPLRAMTAQPLDFESPMS